MSNQWNQDKKAFYAQAAIAQNIFEKELDRMQHQQVVIRKKDRRHLGDSLSNVEGRRLRSAFDVFDFVNNAVSSGVNKAKKDTDKVIKSLSKQLKPAAEDIAGAVSKDVKTLEKVLNKEIAKEAKKLAGPVDEIAKSIAKANEAVKAEIAQKKETEQQTEAPVETAVPEEEQAKPIVQMAPPAAETE